MQKYGYLYIDYVYICQSIVLLGQQAGKMFEIIFNDSCRSTEKKHEIENVAQSTVTWHTIIIIFKQ